VVEVFSKLLPLDLTSVWVATGDADFTDASVKTEMNSAVLAGEAGVFARAAGLVTAAPEDALLLSQVIGVVLMTAKAGEVTLLDKAPGSASAPEDVALFFFFFLVFFFFFAPEASKSVVDSTGAEA